MHTQFKRRFKLIKRAMVDSLTQLDHNTQSAIRELQEQLLAALSAKSEKNLPGVDMERFISMQKAAEMLGVAPKTLSAHKDAIGYTNCFGKIFLERQGLMDYMESCKPERKVKQIMSTRKRNAA